MGSNLKVLHLSSEKSWRGGEQQIAYLIGQLSSMGVDNHVALRKNSVFETYCINQGIRYIPLPFDNTFDIGTALRIKTYCRKQDIDIIHMHSAKSHGIGVLSSFLGNETPLVLSRRVDFIPKNNWVTRWRYNHKNIRRILGVSDKITSIMRKYVDRPELCQTVHSGIDTAKFANGTAVHSLAEEFQIPPGHLIIGNTSALEAHKDYPTFLNTISILVKRGVKLKAFVIGNGSLRERLTGMVRANGLDPHVIFTGFRNDIPRILPSLNIFLMTSETEGLGTSVLDAFAAGIPVVATAAGGIPEMVVDRKTGMLCPVKDANRLAEAVIELVGNPGLRQTVVQGAKDKLSEFTTRATAEKTLAVYREIISGNGSV